MGFHSFLYAYQRVNVSRKLIQIWILLSIGGDLPHGWGGYLYLYGGFLKQGYPISSSIFMGFSMK